jgi:hypothetical protein
MSQLTEHLQNHTARIAEQRGLYSSKDGISTKTRSTPKRLVELLLSPREAFLDIAKRPTWLIPLLIATAAVISGSIFFQWYVKSDIDLIVRERVQQRDQANNRITSEADIEGQVALTRKISSFAPLIGGVATIAAYLLLAAIFYLGLRGIGLTPGFRSTLSVISWSAALTNIFAAIGFFAATLVIGREQLSTYDQAQASNLLATNLGAFMSSNTSPIVKSLTASLDVLTVWRLVLFSVGFGAIACRRSIDKQKVWLLVLALWVGWVTVKALTAYLMISQV